MTPSARETTASGSQAPIEPLRWARKPQQDRSRRTQAALLDATETQLAHATIDELSIAEVANRAGCAVGTVYFHFKNKQGLLHAVFERLADELLVTTELGADPDRWQTATVEDVLREYMLFANRMSGEMPGISRARLTLALADHTVAARQREVHEILTKVIMGLILERKDEIGHPHPEVAAGVVLEQLMAAKLTRTDVPWHTNASGLDDRSFADECVAAAVAYLQLRSARP